MVESATYINRPENGPVEGFVRQFLKLSVYCSPLPPLLPLQIKMEWK